MEDKVPLRPKAFSYVRFSSPEQRKGDSLRRQLERSRKYAQEHGLDLQERSYLDLGMPAYRGKHRKTGQLGRFLEAVKKGIIPAGSYLLVEAMDRLSREVVADALEGFLGIINSGITVVTFRDGRVYSRESIRDDWTQLVISIAYMTSAYEEVQRKSDHSNQWWSKKRARIGEKILTSVCPSWIRVTKGSKVFELIPERAQIVRWIFERAKSGIGNFTIADELNQKFESGIDGFAPWQRDKRGSERWYISYIQKILTNPAVVGDFQPHQTVEGKRVPIGKLENDYYPAVIDRALFDEVRALKSSKRIMAPGQMGDKLRNLFAGILVCARCGKRIVFINKGAYFYLRLPRPLPDGRRLNTWRYKDFETLFLKAIGALDLSKIFDRDSTSVLEAQTVFADKKAELERAQGETVRMLELYKNGGGSVTAVVSELKRLESEVVRLTAEVTSAESAASLAVAARQDAARTAQNIKRLFEKNDFDARIRLRTEIRQLVRQVRVWLPVEPTKSEAAEIRQMEAVKSLPGANIVVAEDSGYAFEIEFENGVKRMVHRSPSGNPTLVVDSTAETFPRVGTLVLNPISTPPKGPDKKKAAAASRATRIARKRNPLKSRAE